MGWRQRTRQFLKALQAKLSEKERKEVQLILNSGQQKLFFRLPLREQRHAFDVYQTLLLDGYTDQDLLQAALLHDNGKANEYGAVGLWHKVAIVLLKKYNRRLLKSIPKEDPHSWRYPFYISWHHAARGAEAAQPFSSPEVVRLIADHQVHQKNDDLLLNALQKADDAN